LAKGSRGRRNNLPAASVAGRRESGYLDHMEQGRETVASGTGGLWGERHVERLRELWPAGLGARRVAALLGPGFTRNAVRAKVRQLGLQAEPPGAGDLGRA